MAGALEMSAHITLLPIPPSCPELNAEEAMWAEILRDNWLSNRIFTSYENIFDQRYDAWNRLVDEPLRLMSICGGRWAHRS